MFLEVGGIDNFNGKLMLEIWENILLAIVSSLKDLFMEIFLDPLSLSNCVWLEDITRVVIALVLHWPSTSIYTIF
jgi:hypothetical protein